MASRTVLVKAQLLANSSASPGILSLHVNLPCNWTRAAGLSVLDALALIYTAGEKQDRGREQDFLAIPL